MSKKIQSFKLAAKVGGVLMTPAMFGTYVSNNCSGLGLMWLFKYPAIWFEVAKIMFIRIYV